MTRICNMPTLIKASNTPTVKDIHAIKGRYHIQRLIEEGEHEQQDFKFAISDARKIARSISAFANHSGGRLLIGIKDNGAIAGLRNEEDIYLVEQAAAMYCVPPVEVHFDAYKTDPGVMVIKATIEPTAQRPICVKEADGKLRAYYRVADENIAAHPLMVKTWRMANEMPGTLSYDSTISAILDIVDSEPVAGINPARIAIDAHISTPMAESIIVQLAAADVITFVYDGHKFVIKRAGDTTA